MWAKKDPEALMWSRFPVFFDRDIWIQDVRERRGWERFTLRLLRVVVVVLRAARDPQRNLEAMSLVYSTLLSLVPFIAVAFSLLKAFGAQYRAEPLVAQMLAPLGAPGIELANRVVEFVTRVNVGVLGAVGVAGLFYTVVSLVGKVEDALNAIWHARRARSLVRKFSDYLSILLVGPVLVFAALAVIASAQSYWLVQRVLEVTGLEAVTLALVEHVTPFVLLAAAFTFLYRCLPAARVRLAAAAVGGFTAAVLWQLAGVAFTALVANSTSYAAIYSGFAVIMLSLIWLDVAWLVVLVGGEVACAFQHPTSYAVVRARPGSRLRERIGLAALAAVARRYVSAEPPWTVDELARALGAPQSTVEEIVDCLVSRQILALTSRPEGVVLVVDPARLSVRDILETVREAGSTGDLPLRLDARTTEVLEHRDQAVRDALHGVTLAALVEGPAPFEAAVTDLARYRRRAAE
jgi:membrane protein